MAPRPDEQDRKIIALLRENAKRTLADIGDQVGLSVAATKRRIDRLERDGVIRGYTVVVDESALSGSIEVVIEIFAADRTAPHDIHDMVEHFDEVVTAF